MTGKPSKDKNKDGASGLLETKGDGAGRKAAIDDARFTAGVVKLYEALLKEPIPKEMLQLIDQIGKQERK
jgi:hypothetical protein